MTESDLKLTTDLLSSKDPLLLKLGCKK